MKTNDITKIQLIQNLVVTFIGHIIRQIYHETLVKNARIGADRLRYSY